MKGFGKAAIGKIDEYLTKGTVKRLQMYRNDYGTVENCKAQHGKGKGKGKAKGKRAKTKGKAK